jgi:hypothetical protein
MSRSTTATASGAVATATEGAPRSAAELQRLVDQAAWAHVLIAAGAGGDGAVRGAKGVIGFDADLPLHRLDIRLRDADLDRGVRATNTVGESVGTVSLRCRMIAREWRALPEREPPASQLDRGRSQRFAIQEATFRLGGDGFHSFGTGRTFPIVQGGRTVLWVAAVGNVLGGFGRLEGVRGTYTLCGELTPDHRLVGHVMVRFVDHDGRLRTSAPLPPPQPTANPTPGVTYLTWIARKGDSPGQANRFSVSPDGQVRGVNIPVPVRRPHVDFIAGGERGFVARELELGEDVAQEIGFGRETKQRGPGSGSDRDPFQFEGVSRYTFFDRDRQTVGSCTANFLEGRSFAMDLPAAPGVPALRFSYYGAFVGGEGCFEGIRGMLYGAAGSVFMPPPAEHIITNLYVARIDDPDGRFLAGEDDPK